MATKLSRIAKVVKMRPEERLTALIHHINEKLLKECHKELQEGKAAGIDKVTKEQYGQNLEENIQDLIARMKRQAYKPQSVRRTYIPKAGSDTFRPLGIPTYEDKLVQMAVAKILNIIYEPEFLPCSFGYRPNRGCHDALKVLNHYIEKRRTNYIVDADIKGFFDNVDHHWMIEFLKHRIADPNLLRLIHRFLKAGIIEEGKYYDSTQGTPQGGVISPILANIYLHYVIDLWFLKAVQTRCQGNAYMVRYADDMIFCFQYKHEAEAFYKALIDRLAKFNLQLAEDKSKIIPFGPQASNDCVQNGAKKPDTFDFLGFTHYCSTAKSGRFRIKRKTKRQSMSAKLKEMNQWIRLRRHMPAKKLVEALNRKLRGHYQYFGITDNYEALRTYYESVKKMLYKWLNRRSQRKSFNWELYQLFLRVCPLVKPKIKTSIYELKPHISYIL